MLPRATHTRSDREAARGKQGGRTLEIQRLIGRSLRACVDRGLLGERTITLDCDVLQADGGTRTAAITGAYVALVDAVQGLLDSRAIKPPSCNRQPVVGAVAAVRSEEHTSELQSLMRNSYAVSCLKKQNNT